MTPAVTTLSYANVDRYMRSVADEHEADPERPVDLDWGTLARVETVAGFVLGAALLGRLGCAPLSVTLPAAPHRLRLARTGIIFALANRSAKTRLVGATAEELNLRAWRKTWLPAAPFSFRELDRFSSPPAAWRGRADDDPDVIAADQASFVNAHLSGVGSGRPRVVATVQPWLERLLPANTARSHPKFGETVADVVAELVRNIREHAHPADGSEVMKSLLKIAISRGETNLVYVAVQDTGLGIMASAKRKIAKGGEPISDDEALLERLFDGSLEPWGMGRGMGLPKIWQTCKEYGGSLRVVTQALRMEGEGESLRVKNGGFDLSGTVVSMAFPIPASTRSDH